MASIVSAGTTSGTSLNLSADTSGVLQLATNGTTTAVTIDTSQNVGIGTASPTFSAGGGLNVANSTFATLRARGGSSTGTDFAGGSDGKGYVYVRDNADLIIGTNNTERMRITSAGNVGIGLTSPTFPLVVQTAGTSTAVAGNVIARFQSTSTGYDSTIQFSDNITNSGFVSMNSGNMIIGSFGTESIRFKSGGTVILQGGSTSATGVGITFPATQSASSNANTLDDYEEGTWTPQIGSDGTQPTVTYSSQFGNYTKIGNRVYVEFYLQWTGTSGGSGSLTIKNLPFAASAYSPDSRGFSYLFAWNGVVFTGVVASVLQAGDTYTLPYQNNNGSITSLGLSSVSSGGAFRASFYYIV